MKPMLCRLCAYFAPGLPRPTNSRMTRHPASAYFFLSPAGFAAGALAPAADVFARQRLDAGGQLDVGQMQRVADFQRADIGLDVLRNVVDRAFQIDRVGD